MRRNRGTTVHPHACGVYSSSSLGGSESGGPSPRMWGLPRRSSRAPERRPVHPHACGVYVTSWLAPSSAFGPSPRMWGLRGHAAARHRRLRSIPTHVGFTTGPRRRPCRPPVHPHACGVYSARHGHIELIIGPSPRMWGLRRNPPTDTVITRSIPTHVGFTLTAVTVFPTPPVHPHACGVYS